MAPSSSGQGIDEEEDNNNSSSSKEPPSSGRESDKDLPPAEDEEHDPPQDTGKTASKNAYGAFHDAPTRWNTSIGERKQRCRKAKPATGIDPSAFDHTKLQHKYKKSRFVKRTRKPSTKSTQKRPSAAAAAQTRVSNPAVGNLDSADQAAARHAADPTSNHTHESISMPVSANTAAGTARENAQLRAQLEVALAKQEAAEARAATERANRQRCDDQLRIVTAERDSALQHNAELQQRVTDTEDRLALCESSAIEVSSKSFITSLAKPPTFSGRHKDSLQARDWLQTINDYLNSSHIAKTESQKIQFAESYLVGEARRTWHTTRNTLCDSTDQSQSPYAGITFSQFEQALIDRWDPACSMVNAMNELDDLHQRGSLSSFISNFDRLCSFIPNITDREKVHRFLRNIDQDLVPILATDPATKDRWQRYSDLRSYALNYVASATAAKPRRAVAHAAKRTGILQQIQEAATNGKTALKRLKTDGSGGFITPSYLSRKPHNGNTEGKTQSNGSHGGNPFTDYKNKREETFSRHYKTVNYCHAKSICICCYEEYTKATVGQHRENCTAPPKKGLPPGYKLPNRTH